MGISAATAAAMMRRLIPFLLFTPCPFFGLSANRRTVRSCADGKKLRDRSTAQLCTEIKKRFACPGRIDPPTLAVLILRVGPWVSPNPSESNEACQQPGAITTTFYSSIGNVAARVAGSGRTEQTAVAEVGAAGPFQLLVVAAQRIS